MRAAPDHGMIHLGSSHSVSETVAGLETILKSEDLTILARIDHSVDAAKGSLEMRATQLLIFWKAPSGTSVSNLIRGKRGSSEVVVEPAAVNNEQEGFGRSSGVKRSYYRIAIPLSQLWSNYVGSPNGSLRIEVFENRLERI
jgi:nitrile hydratase subunit beta